MRFLLGVVLFLSASQVFSQTGTNFLPVILQDQHIHDQNISKCMGGEIEELTLYILQLEKRIGKLEENSK